MNVIDSYLDTLFAPYPDSPRMREARTELRAMMEDKQQGLMDAGHTEAQAVGTVIAEFGSLEEVAPVLGIDQEMHPAHNWEGSGPQHPLLTVERAREYVAAVRGVQPLSALAIPLFVLAPVPLIALLGLSEMTGAPLSDGWAVGIGLVVLLILVTAGVLLMVLRDSRLADMRDIAEGRFTGSAPVRAYAREVGRDHRRGTAVSSAIAIALWILSAVPIFLAMMLADAGALTFVTDADPLILFGVCGTLTMIAIGLAVHTRTSWVESVTSALEQETEAAPETSSSPVVRVIAALYWPVATAIYLGWSFVTGDWGSTWVVWPVAGVLYGALWAVESALSGLSTEPARR